MAGIRSSPKSVSLEVLFKIIEQMKKSICKINIENSYKTGFFCYIPFKNKKIPSLITNNHIIDETFINNNTFINIELNNETKKINLKDNRIIYTSRKYDITIIEIIPQTDLIYNFLDIDENIFNKEENYFIENSIYLLQCDNKVSFGILKNIGEYRIIHSCNADHYSSGYPLINLSNEKIIGIYIGFKNNANYNLGTFLKYPINDFIDKFNNIKDETKINNFIKKINDLENEYKQEKEKNKITKEKINQMQILLNKNNSNLNKGNINEIDVILQKDQIIDDLKSKLDRFPFELSQGEKLMSIIFTNKRENFIYSMICKNTDKFYKIESQLYKVFPEYFKKKNDFIANFIDYINI